MQVSVIVSTYNSPRYLLAVLQSIANQILKPHEIIVVDDGSCMEVVERFRQGSISLTIKVIHCWQPDSEFRLARARNLGALKASGTFLLFLDGDCVLPPKFLQQQVSFYKRSRLVFCSRQLLDAQSTQSFLDKGSFKKSRKFWRLWLGFLRAKPERSWRIPRGFCFALYREDYLSVRGCDEQYIGWGLEDSDLFVRLGNFGICLFDGRYAGCVIHLWHPDVKHQVSQNLTRFGVTLSNRRVLSERSCIQA